MDDITVKDILSANFDEDTFPELLNRLLVFEASKYKIPLSNIHVCRKTAPDGGIDGIVSVIDKETDLLKAPVSVYQCKAYKYKDTSIDEDLKPFPKTGKAKRQKKLNNNDYGTKKRLVQLLKEGAYYIWFVKRILTYNEKEDIKNKTVNVFEKHYKLNLSKEKVVVFDAGQIQTICNQDYLLKVYVNTVLNRGVPDSFIPFQIWGTILPNLKRFNPYVSTEIIKEWSRTLETMITSEKAELCFIYGPSGIGKTRLIHNVLTHLLSKTQQTNPEQAPILSQRIIYITMKEQSDKVLNSFLQVLNNTSEHIFIIDDCDSDTGEKVISKSKDTDNISNRNKVIILTADIDFVRTRQVDKIEMTSEKCKSIVKKYLESITINPIDTVADSTLKYQIEEWSDGFVYFAILMAGSYNDKSLLRNMDNILSVGYDVSKKIIDSIYGDQKTSAHSVLQACSLFSYFGFYDDLSYEVDSIATDIVILGASISKTDKISQVKEICEKGLLYGIFEKRGRHLSIRPKPLAFFLFSGYLGKIHNINVFIDLLSQLNLIEQFCNQIKDFGGLPKVKEISEELLKRGFDPLSDRNILFSEQGARVFRSICEVHPSQCMIVLKKTFQHLSLEAVKDFYDGRREIIYSLQTLVFCKVYFKDAIFVLFRLAVGENESWSNNATGIISQLFCILLPGTEASLETRKEVIRSLYVSSEDEESLNVVLKILEQSIRSRHFSRIGGIKSLSGGVTRKDYHPTNRLEIEDYVAHNLEILKSIAGHKDKKLRVIALNSILNELHGFILAGFWDLFLKVFENYHWDMNSKIKIQKTLNTAFQFGYFKQEKDKRSAEEYSDKLWENKVLKDLVNYVIVPEYEEGVSEIHTKIDSLIDNILGNDINIIPYIRALCFDTARETYYFGCRLAEKKYRVGEVLEEFLNILKQDNNVSLSFVLGYINTLDIRNKRSFYDSIINETDLHRYAFSLISYSKAPFNIIQKLFPLADKYPDYILELHHFATGQSTSHLTDTEKNKLYDHICKYGAIGKQITLDSIRMDMFPEKSIEPQFEDRIKKLILDPDILAPTVFFSSVIYNWVKLWKLMLLKDQTLAKKVTDILFDLYEKKNDELNLYTHCSELFKILYNDYFELFWKRFTKILLKNDFVLSFKIKHDFGWGAGINSGSALIGSKHSSKILQWCTIKGSTRASAVIGIIRLYEDKERTAEWTDTAITLIKKYHTHSEFQDTLISSLGSYTWSGSVTHYIDKQINLMEKLKQLDEITDTEWIDERVEYLKQSKEHKKIREEEMFLR